MSHSTNLARQRADPPRPRRGPAAGRRYDPRPGTECALDLHAHGRCPGPRLDRRARPRAGPAPDPAPGRASVWPVAVFAITFGALVVHALVVQNAYSAPIGSLIALYTVAQMLDRRRSGLVTAFAGVVFLLVSIYKGLLPVGLSGVIQTELALLAVWTLGTWSRERRVYLDTVEERAARLEREREERDARAVTEERERIARELHDVVTHHVSVIVIQAGAALRALDRRPDDARTAVAAIDATGRRRWPTCAGCRDPGSPIRPASSRRGRHDLRSARADAGLRPAGRTPGAGARRRPTRRADRRGRAPTADPGIELSAYRIVQEALTNSLKHASGASARHASPTVPPSWRSRSRTAAARAVAASACPASPVAG